MDFYSWEPMLFVHWDFAGSDIFYKDPVEKAEAAVVPKGTLPKTARQGFLL